MKRSLIFLILLLLSTNVFALAGDINQDNQVNLQDIQLIVNDFGKTSGFSTQVDLAPPAGEIDIFDVMVVVKNWRLNETNINNSTNTSDKIAPNIATVTAASSSTSATITWTTDEPSDTQIEYGLTTNYGSNTTLNQALVTSHSQTITGLDTNTVYHYKVKSKDADNNRATSSDFTFTTSSNPLTFTISSMGSCMEGTPYSRTFTASGGTPPYNFTKVSGNFPTWASFNSPNLSGTPLVSNSSFRIKVTDNQGVNKEQDFTLNCIAQGTGPHDYFNALCARSDKAFCYSLRDKTQVTKYYGAAPAGIYDMEYLYPNDSDPRAQDAMRMRVPDGYKGPAGALRVPVGPTNGKSMLFAMDLWMGAEWNANHSLLAIHKIGPIYFRRAGLASWLGMQNHYQAAQAHVHNLPPGGPYVSMPYAHADDPYAFKHPNYWRDSTTGFPRADLPYDASSRERRLYPEAAQPFDTSVDPSGAEFGLVAERWTRIWHYFERVPSEDWVSTSSLYTGQTMAAYKWSIWFADTVREPTLHLNEVIVGIPITMTTQIAEAHMGFGAGNSNNPATWIGRGDLIAYTRDWVVLHGTSKADVLAMLQKPGSFATLPPPSPLPPAPQPTPTPTPAPTGAFSIAVLPDTQLYTELVGGAEIFNSQTKWIADNKNVKNIVAVSHLGDIVENNVNIPEWQIADTAMKTLDDINIPYGILPGNHDYDGNNEAGFTNYAKYFGPNRFAGKSWYGGNSDVQNRNSYIKFSAGGNNYLLVSLRMAPAVSDITWANSIIQSHPNHKIIIATHSYVNTAGVINDYGLATWSNLVVPNENVFMVLNGHSLGDAEYLKTDTIGNRKVHQMLSNYQTRKYGGAGLMRLLTFNTNNTVSVQTFSTWISSEADCKSGRYTVSDNMAWVNGMCHEVDSNSQFTIDLS